MRCHTASCNSVNNGCRFSSEMKNLLTEKDKMLAGEIYSPVDPQLLSERQFAKSLIWRISQVNPADARTLSLLTKELLPLASKDIRVEWPFQCDYGYNISTGKRVFINYNCVLLDVAKISIGNYVFIGPGVHIYTATHPLDALARRKQSFGKEVHIGDDCWIGGKAVICPGAIIGAGTVVAAGSVVTGQVPANVLVAGNPARIIRHLKPSP